MKHFFILFSITLLLFVLSCYSPTNNSKSDSVKNQIKIQNGLYLILNEITDSTAKPNNGIIIPYNHELMDDDAFGQKTFLVIDTSEFVKLELSESPIGVEQEDKRINLLLTLTDAGKIQLANFTGKHLNQSVAIVVDGKAVTRHKVKAKIDGGKLQITRCTESGCKYLLLTLKENLKK